MMNCFGGVRRGWLLPCIGSALMAALLGAGCAASLSENSEIRVTQLQCDHQTDPLGVDESPGLEWIMQSNERGARQTAYEIQVASSVGALRSGAADLWDSGKIVSDDSALVPYAGKPLRSQTHYFWRVRVWDERDASSAWSKEGHWATGVLGLQPWAATWISGRTNGAYKDAPSYWFRKSFELDDPHLTTALCSVASVGYHELYVNGQKVGKDVMAPAVSDLSKRALSVTRDIAPYLRKGRNTIAVWLGEGWAGHSGRMWYSGSDLGWSREPCFLLQASLHGAQENLQITSGPDWKCHRAGTDSNYPTNYHNLGGELQDDRAFIPDWDAPAFDDSSWPSAIACETPLTVSPQIVQCNQSYEELHPVEIKEVKPGIYQADMGRQFSGWIQLEAEAQPGTKIEISMSERQPEASSYGQQNAWIVGPEGRGTFCNHFKHQAGRWITVGGLKTPLQAGQLRGIVITTGYDRLGHFSCSSDFYNRLYETTLWTFRQLTLDGYLVDCPHRERMGYGDGINGVQTAMSSFSTGPFFEKWARDWRDVQQPDGNVPFTAPTYSGGGGPMWSDTLVHLPWLIYLYYGDPKPMREDYPAIQRWMAFQQSKCVNHILQFHTGPSNVVQPEWSFLGDWVYPGHQQAPNGHDRETLFMNNCYYLRTLRTVQRIAAGLGRSEDARQYEAEADAAAEAIQNEFWDAAAQSYPGDRETTPASALFADLPPDNVRPLVQAQLEARIKKKSALDTGILGTYFMIQALMAERRSDLIDIVASRQEYPGWGYMLSHGATCIWEQWDGNNSRCHSSFLSIGDWFIEGIAGIRPDPDAPGFRHFFIEPGVCGHLTHASADVDCGYGRISSHWKIENGQFMLDVQVPVNTTATVFVPSASAHDVAESGHVIEDVSAVKFVEFKNGQARLDISSGAYHFTSPVL